MLQIDKQKTPSRRDICDYRRISANSYRGRDYGIFLRDHGIVTLAGKQCFHRIIHGLIGGVTAFPSES